MIVHLQYRHLAECNELVSEKKSSERSVVKSPLSKGQPSTGRVIWKIVISSTQFCTVEEFNYCCVPVFGKRSCTINTVNDARFRNMLKVFEPRYTPPNPTTFSRRYLPSLYHKDKAKNVIWAEIFCIDN